MNLPFRREVFNLCKKLQKNDGTEAIKKVIMSIKFTKEDKETGKIPENAHGDFIQLAEHINTQFHGYLFTDDYADKIQLPAFTKIEHLTSEERILIERGHKTLTRLIELCLIDISKKSKIVADAMSPYYLYRELSLNNDIKPLLNDSEYNDLVQAFKKGKVYKVLYDSDIALIFDKLNLNQMQSLLGSINKELSMSFVDDVPPGLNNLSMKLINKQMGLPDVLYAFSVMIYALKESLRIACQLLFGAICGGDLIVLDNNNLINIEKRMSSIICNYYKVFIQGRIFSFAGPLIGDILLMDCYDSNDSHIHEFGMITSTTIQFGGEYGQTSKISFITVDDELIPISNITQAILQHGLPKIDPSLILNNPPF